MADQTAYISAGLGGARSDGQSPDSQVNTAYIGAGFGAQVEEAAVVPDPPETSKEDGLRFSPGCCCSTVASGCLIGGDDFDRASSTDLGELWEERRASSGWQIVGDGDNGILYTDIPDDLAIYQIPHPDDISDMIAWAEVKGVTAGDQARVVIAWKDDDNYLFAELEFDANCGYLRAYQRKDGYTTMLKEIVIDGGFLDTWHTLYACFDPDASPYEGDGRFEARVETASQVWYTVAEGITGVDGTYAGLATGDNYGGIWFDNFELWKGQNEDDPECPTCKRGVSSCDISTDYFSRPNGSDLGCLWETITASSDFQILNGSLSTTIPYDIVKHELQHPDGEPNLWARVLFKGQANGDTGRLLIAWADVDNYLWVELEVGDCGTLRLFERDGGSVVQIGRDMPVMNATLNEWHAIEVCYSDGDASNDARLYGKITTNNGEVISHSGEATATGAYAGLASGPMSSYVYFDDFELEKLKSEDNPECRPCEDSDECLIIDDLFRRDDLGLGCRWSLMSGTAPTHYYTPGGIGNVRFFAPGALKLEIRHPDEKIPSDQWVWYEWTVSYASTGMFVYDGEILYTARFYVGLLDSSNHYYVEVQGVYRTNTGPYGGPFHFLEHSQRLFTAAGAQVGSTNTVSMSIYPPFGQGQVLFLFATKVCYHGDTIHANTSTTAGNLTDSWSTTDTGGRHIGMGAGEGTCESVNFQRVWFERARNTIWEDCPFCNREQSCNACKNDVMPDIVRMTLTGVKEFDDPPNRVCAKCNLLNGSMVLHTLNSLCTVPWYLDGLFGIKLHPDFVLAGRCCWGSDQWLNLIRGYFGGAHGIDAQIAVQMVRFDTGNWGALGRLFIGCTRAWSSELHYYIHDAGSERPDCDNFYRWELTWLGCYQPTPGVSCDVCDVTNSKILLTAI